MKRTIFLLGILLTTGVVAPSYAEEHAMPTKHDHEMNMKETHFDQRVSLNMMPQMKQHQLANMRAHLKAVQAIIGMIANDKFSEASKVAHNKLGFTPEMKKMCNMFGNAEFRDLGLAFHKSADELGEVLKTGDTKLSLVALHKTMNSCVACHAAFKQ